MPFKAGESGNPEGRPKGSRNKATAELRTFVAELLAENMEQIRQDLKAVKPGSRLFFFEKLLKYAIPEMRTHQLSIEKLDDEQLGELFDEVMNNLKDGEDE